MSIADSDLIKLSLPEKLRLLEVLWDSIVADPDQVPIPEGLIEELDRRKEEYLRNPESARSWEEVKTSIRARHG